jgi:hypothetical protein
MRVEIWADPTAKCRADKYRAEMIRAIAAQMLVETDTATLNELLEQLTRLMESERQDQLPN